MKAAPVWVQLFRHQDDKQVKELVIVEGEMDAMSVWEAQPNWDVSLYLGAPAAENTKLYEWVSYYDKIVIFPDNDETAKATAGQ